MDGNTGNLAPIARTDGLIVRELGNEVLVYDEQTNIAHSLGATAAFVWRHCDGRTSVEEIAALLQEESLSITVQDGSVWAAVEELGKNNLLKEEALRLESGRGISRREVLKLGAAATAAPLIWSLITPATGLAQVVTCPSACCPGSPSICIKHSNTGCVTSNLPCCGCTDEGCPGPGGTCSVGVSCTPCCKPTAGGAGVCGCINTNGDCA